MKVPGESPVEIPPKPLAKVPLEAFIKVPLLTVIRRSHQKLGFIYHL